MGDPPRALLGGPRIITWVFTVGFCLLVVSGTGVASIFVERSWNVFVESILANEVKSIESIPPVAQRTRPAVVILGTSLIAAAAQNGDLPVPPFPDSIQVVIISGNPGNPEWVEKLIPVLHRVHPDLVLFEANLMRRPRSARPTLFSKLQHLEWALFWQPAGPGGQKSCHGIIRKKSAKVGNVDASYQGWFDPARIWLNRLPALIDLQSEGVQVGVLDMPRSTELEEAAPNLVKWRDHMAEILSRSGIAMWSAPGNWPSEYFCDMAHLNVEGAVIFDRWFDSRLAQALNLP